MQCEITRELVRRLLPGRMAESNKGSYGSVLAAAGSMAYRGAAALCTEGALRGGAGLVYLASVEPVIQLVLSRTPECCACGCRTAANGGIHPQDADALRRRIREIFRLSQGKMKQGYDCIVVARTRAAHADYWELKRAFEKTCKKLDLWEIQA